jgi:hypothetical protein
MIVKFYIPAISENAQLRSEREGLEAKLEEEQREEQRLRDRIRWLLNPNDPRYLESYVRDKLDRSRPGEIILRMDPMDLRMERERDRRLDSLLPGDAAPEPDAEPMLPNLVQ